MGIVWMPGGGGGADLDAVTAGRPDILAGKVIVNKDGEPLTGTMPNRGAISQALNAGGSYTIPEGYHSGAGKVTANSLASQTGATATAAHILSGQTAWVNGSKITGNITSMGGQTVNPGAAQQTVATSGKYLTGNVAVNAVSNLSSGNIKKGINVGGVVGTWEGWVPTATDLYLRGNNIRGWSVVKDASLDAGQISVTGNDFSVQTTFSMVGQNQLNIEGYHSTGVSVIKEIRLWRMASTGSVMIGYIVRTDNAAGNYVISFNITNYQINDVIRINMFQMRGAVYRIWLS